ncbi:amidase [Fodinicurvata sp. EGI_FJ10296]|uniref:amidase n=1 Tax=Fodinicurvata sp. EGI_FJ10296 TaxID=3231908 RepID=UPI0034562B76
MPLPLPTHRRLSELSEQFGFSLSEQAIDSYRELMTPNIEAYRVVDAMVDDPLAVKYPRTPGSRPDAADNPMNAWAVKSTIKGADSGPLAGKRLAIKDNVMVAGVPMANGSSTLEGYVPEADATVVSRILDAGGEIAGKATSEYFCLSGGSHTSATGPVHNPHRHGFSAGGSSSGCGALVGAGEVDMAIGGDQGGSIRMPAAFSGICGMKPTYGLVPYTGIMPIEMTIDHTGPMTRTVADNAVLLEVIAGEDGLDPRQYAPRTSVYSQGVSAGADGMTIGVLAEGFGHDNSEAAVDEGVREAARRLEGQGAVIRPVSVPMHREGLAIWTPIILEGFVDVLMSGNACGTNWRGYYPVSLADAHSRWRLRADEMPDTVKLSMLVGAHMADAHQGRLYAKAQNLARRLRLAYHTVLRGEVDALLLPTLPMTATPIPGDDAPTALIIQRAFEMIANTAPFNVTGHPAISVPCATSGGLPVGAMIVGRHWDEFNLYRAAAALERSADWTKCAM